MDKLESGVVALETERGPVYVQPSGWERLYMVWTFRHFNSLPLKTLNSRQRKMVERLPRCGVRLHGGLNQIQVIGTIEGASIPSFQSSSPTEETAPRTPVEDAFIPAFLQDSIPPAIREVPRIQQRSFSGSKFALATATVALSAVAVIAAWPSLELKELFATPKVEASRPVVKTDPVAVPEQNKPPETLPEIVPASVAPASADLTKPPVEAAPVAPSAEENNVPRPAVESEAKATPARPATEEHKIPVPLSKAAPAPKEKNPILASIREPEIQEVIHRMEVSGPPRTIIYPEYPPTSVRGKVTLKAIIGIDGKVRDVTILSGNRILSAAAVRAVRRWQYNPFYKDGEAVEAETKVGVVFVATDAISVTFPAASPAPE